MSDDVPWTYHARRTAACSPGRMFLLPPHRASAPLQVLPCTKGLPSQKPRPVPVSLSDYGPALTPGGIGHLCKSVPLRLITALPLFLARGVNCPGEMRRGWMSMDSSRNRVLPCSHNEAANLIPQAMSQPSKPWLLAPLLMLTSNMYDHRLHQSRADASPLNKRVRGSQKPGNKADTAAAEK